MSFEDDRGNEVGVSGGPLQLEPARGVGQLHHRARLPGDAYTLARLLLDEATDQDRATWQGSSPIDWANESFAISTSPSVGYCVRADAGCWYGPDNERLGPGEPEKIVAVDRAYIETQVPVVREQALAE